MADGIKLVDGKYLEYKGRPLVREGDTLCYGDMSEKCILILEILSYKKEGNKGRLAVFPHTAQQAFNQSDTPFRVPARVYAQAIFILW